jgi:tetratricopeptide (TPR) repeat protein
VPERFRYKAFISYSHRDHAWARWLHHAIESYRTPRHLVSEAVPANLVPVFRDREELPSAHDLSTRINEALSESENLVVVCSPAARASRYTNQEIEAFCRSGRSERVFCLIVDGDPTAKDTDQDCFPPALRQRYDSSGRTVPGEIEPIAADLRPEGDGRQLARLKIIAGLLGVGLDDLRQRELQRRFQRLATYAAVSSLALVITIFLAISAHVARKEADQRRTQAEDLLGFMVGDLRDSLEPLGRLDVLEKIGGQAMDYFATVKLADLTEDELSRHAQVITQIGEIRVSQRQYQAAIQAFTEAYERSATLSRMDSADGDRLFTRSQAEFWVGYVHWRKGDLEDARVWLTKYLESSYSLVALDPGRTDWAIEVAYGHHNLAVLALDAGDLDLARDGFQDVILTLRQIAEEDDEADLRRDIADAESWLGNVAFASGDLSGARRHYGKSAAILEEIITEQPDNRGLRYSWSHATYFVVLVDSVSGERARAARLADETIALLDALASHDPDNLEWRRSSAKPRIARANLYLAEGELALAREHIESAVEVLEQLVERNQSDVSVHEALADAYLALGWLERDSGAPSAAREALNRSFENVETLPADGIPGRDRRGRMAAGLVLMGELHAADGTEEAARASWEQALELAGDLSEVSHSPLLLDPISRALVLSGASETAHEIRARLAAMGYRPLRSWPDAGSRAATGAG